MDDRRSRRCRAACPVAIAAGVLAACGGGGGADETPPPPILAVSIINAFPALSFEQPLAFVTSPGGDQVYVAVRAGIVYRFDNDPAATTTNVALDIRDQTDASADEMGLLGIAFEPAAGAGGPLYVNRTVGSNNIEPGPDDPPPTQGPPDFTVISRFAATANGDFGAETELLRFEQPFTNHNGGWLGFGPDAKLYIASGDGGGGGDPLGNAQNPGNLLGKILRIDADGSVPADNPFAAEPGARSEIWALGLRNPFRAGFDRETGELWVADVGQSELEEINLIERGGNYGWRKFEGTQVFEPDDPTPDNTIGPLYEYDHGDGRCSVTGGTVYRGSAIPALVGRYVFADFCSREVWALRRDGSGVDVVELGSVPGNPSSFGEDRDGELYITAFDGKIYKLVPGS